MTVPILCVVCFCFLCWIVVLKLEISEANKELERLKGLLKTKLGHLGKDVEVKGGLSLNVRGG
jgi:hypothetical protein